MLRERKKLDLCWNREEVSMRSVTVDYDFFGFVGDSCFAFWMVAWQCDSDHVSYCIIRVLDFHGFDVSNYLTMLTPLLQQ